DPVGGVGEGRGSPAGAQVPHPLQVAMPVEPGPLHPLAIALEHPAADVGVQGGRLDAQELAGLGGAEVRLPLDLDHVASRLRDLTIAVNILQYKSTYAYNEACWIEPSRTCSGTTFPTAGSRRSGSNPA